MEHGETGVHIDDEDVALVYCAACNSWVEHYGDPEKTLFEHMGELHD